MGPQSGLLPGRAGSGSGSGLRLSAEWQRVEEGGAFASLSGQLSPRRSSKDNYMSSSDEATSSVSGEVTSLSGNTARKRRSPDDKNASRPMGGRLPKIPKPNPQKSTVKARVGRWTKEEEVYAEYLTSLFMQGVLPDCDIHTTLRAYLAGKLNCKPMRITKRYSAESYDGKMMYTPSGVVMPDLSKLEMIREKYIQSVERPKTKRSHKKKGETPRVWDILTSDGGTQSSGGNSGDQDSDLGWRSIGGICSVGPPEGCHSDDSCGQLSPDGMEILLEALQQR